MGMHHAPPNISKAAFFQPCSAFTLRPAGTHAAFPDLTGEIEAGTGKMTVDLYQIKCD